MEGLLTEKPTNKCKGSRFVQVVNLWLMILFNYVAFTVNASCRSNEEKQVKLL